MTEGKTCPKCGAPLPADAPVGICPTCLMQAGIPSAQDAGSGPEMKPTTATSGFTPPEPEALAKHFPQLEILELLGKGGMGAVYKARQKGLDRLVAVKILPPEVAGDPAFAERFGREARALAKLSHQNIVSVFDSGQADGQYYFVMEYVDGANLRHVIEAGALKPEEALAIVPQICQALQFAHNEGVVHRDIKPENILVDKQGRVKIADFGLAKLLGVAPAEFSLTGTHQAMGTLHYMAPEQMRGAGSVDHRADIYSLGVVFYEMLTGQLPIGRFEPPSKKVQIDVRLDEVVLRSLENEPERRYQQASDLQSDVSAISADRPPLAQPQTAARRPDSRLGAPDLARRSLVASPADALVVVAAVSLLTALGIAMWLRFAPNRSLFEANALSTLQAMAATHAGYGVVMLGAGLLLRRLRARMLVLLCATVVGVAVPAMLVLNVVMEWGRVPQWPALIPMWLGVPVAVWVAFVLFRRQVREAFLAESQRRADARISEDPSGLAPRFSRKAIVGACWAPVCLLLMLSFTTFDQSAPQIYEASGAAEAAVERIGETSFVEPEEHAGARDEDARSGLSWWQLALMVTVLPLGLGAPFGTTILGVVSIADIRHSRGRLTGLPLALADALLFPLLALDGLIVGLFWYLCVVGYEIAWPEAASNARAAYVSVGLMLLLSLPTCAYLNYRIVRAAWRKASE